MEAGLRTPLLDFFRRGEVARDVRLLAAQGAVAPRPVEQLGLLMMLTGDADAEVRATAEATLARIPPHLIAAFIARSDAPLELREFFVARGIEPVADPSAADDPLVDTDDQDYGSEAVTDAERASIVQRLQSMSVPEKVRAAMKGSREMRAILIRDPNKLVAMAVLSSPKMTENEIEGIARMGNVSDDVLRTIGQTRAWTKNYTILLGLVKNSKTPIAVSLTLLSRLNDRDLRNLSTDRNVPEPLRIAARKRVMSGEK
ncbi:MAG: hypothetical protein AB1635_01710 [Acidobacteriota bacterium]